MSEMDDLKKAMQEINSLSESLRTDSATSKLLQDLKSKIAPIPNFNLPELHLRESPNATFVTPPSHEEVNEYQSASVFMSALANEALQWKEQLPEEYQPAILAFLYGGVQINVQSLAQVSFHGIRIEGTMNGGPCSLLAHQATVQVLCYGEPITSENPRRPIGFVWENNSVEV